MKKFEFVVEEILSRSVIIEAEDVEQAYEKANEMYDNEEIVLDYKDFLGSSVELISEIEEE